MKYWKRKANHWYLSVNKNKSRKIERKIVDNFKKSKNGVVDYRAGTGAGILTTLSRSRVKMERLHNTDAVARKGFLDLHCRRKQLLSTYYNFYQPTPCGLFNGHPPVAILSWLCLYNNHKHVPNSLHNNNNKYY